MDKIENLRGEIARREAELADLKSQLAAAESEPEVSEQIAWPWPLQKHEYERYGRQMIVPNFGIQGIKDPPRYTASPVMTRSEC